LGVATTVNIGASEGTLSTIVVTAGAIQAVDVTSMESATNINKTELERIPVERDPLAVALLAPGVIEGEFGGISFGGSSVAENTVYINGLNVTDFYNRVGFSSVPYSFYKEFQIKTGGYSVEFGRTTGGVINAVTQSGTNEFKFGAEAVWEPSFLQTEGSDHYDADGNPYYISSYDEYERRNLNVYASGPIVKDKLFFYALYEARDYQPSNTTSTGNLLNEGDADDGFWGTKLDWQINDNHLLEFLGFGDSNSTATDIYQFDLASGNRGEYSNTRFIDNGGTNWSATYTGYLTDSFSMKAMYGENEREFAQSSLNDINCNRIRDRRDVGNGDIGCTSTSTVAERLDTREAARLDFEWTLGDHLLRFGLDHETNTSDHSQFYPGPDRLLYEINDTSPGATLANGGVVPDGVTAYVWTRSNEVDGTFESINSAYYLEDNWTVTPNLVLNAGLRMEAFDNKNSDGDSYIKIDDMLAPRFGFTWDTVGDGRTKIFGTLGRYFLPVANVINIKQAGGFADVRTFYVFNGLEDFEFNGNIYQRPILGPQIGPVDDSQGDGTVGDLRGEVDKNMDPVYQDELILGFQSMMGEKWSVGARAIFRDLTNAIDDMELTSNGI
ncbi:MAG: TonB-dependent receptor, partial [Dokdonella sp.]